jgi:hypothetical protein
MITDYNHIKDLVNKTWGVCIDKSDIIPYQFQRKSSGLNLAFNLNDILTDAVVNGKQRYVLFGDFTFQANITSLAGLGSTNLIVGLCDKKFDVVPNISPDNRVFERTFDFTSDTADLSYNDVLLTNVYGGTVGQGVEIIYSFRGVIIKVR